MSHAISQSLAMARSTSIWVISNLDSSFKFSSCPLISSKIDVGEKWFKWIREIIWTFQQLIVILPSLWFNSRCFSSLSSVVNLSKCWYWMYQFEFKMWKVSIGLFQAISHEIFGFGLEDSQKMSKIDPKQPLEGIKFTTFHLLFRANVTSDRFWMFLHMNRQFPVPRIRFSADIAFINIFISMINQMCIQRNLCSHDPVTSIDMASKSISVKGRINVGWVNSNMSLSFHAELHEKLTSFSRWSRWAGSCECLRTWPDWFIWC